MEIENGIFTVQALELEITRMEKMIRDGYEPGSPQDLEVCVEACKEIFEPIIPLRQIAGRDLVVSIKMDPGGPWDPSGLIRYHMGYTHPIVCATATALSGEHSCAGCMLDWAEKRDIILTETCDRFELLPAQAKPWTPEYRIKRLEKTLKAVKEI